ncbi:MAG TPA: lipoprotein [Steroidobacteraceae bacterium]|nr:lipoprotein [Steroidobacteraceae bacterium]
MIGRRARGWILALGALGVCAGCGYKGDLYLPERNATVVTHPAQAEPPVPQAQPATKKKDKPAPAPRSPPAPPAS